MPETLVDPVVSRVKFDRELAQFREMEGEYRQRGWFLIDSIFPKIRVLFAAPKLKPAAVLFGAELDFTNYDFWAPSVRIIDPFTGKPYTLKELPVQFIQAHEREVQVPLGFPPGMSTQRAVVQQSLMQAYHPDDVPFFCIPGVREYHEQPAHSGDSWLLHRKSGEGSLFNILEKLYVYGVEPLMGYQLGIQLQIVGFQHKGFQP